MRSTYLFDRLGLEVKTQNEANMIDFERLLELGNPRFLSLCLKSGFELHYMV